MEEFKSFTCFVISCNTSNACGFDNCGCANISISITVILSGGIYDWVLFLKIFVVNSSFILKCSVTVKFAKVSSLTNADCS